MSSLIFLIFISLYSNAFDRIADDTKINRKKPFTIFMHPGRSTTIDLPCAISYAVPGTHGDVKAEIGPDRDSSLLVWLSTEASSPTNLTVRCHNNKIVIFDILPGRKHQDYLNVTGFESSFANGKKLVSSSSNYKEEVAHDTRKKHLISTSEGVK